MSLKNVILSIQFLKQEQNHLSMDFPARVKIVRKNIQVERGEGKPKKRLFFGGKK